MAKFEFYLDRPFRPGTHELMKQYKREKKSVKSLFNTKECAVYLYIYIPQNSGNKHYLMKFNTTEKILPAEWDFEKKLVKSNIPGSIEFNLALTDLLQRVTDTYRNTMRLNPETTVVELKEIINGVLYQKMPKPKAKGFYEVYLEFMDEKRYDLKETTLKKYKTLRSLLVEFEEVTDYKISFENIDYSFDVKFRNFLYQHKNHCNDTVAKYYECLSAFMNWALEREYHKNIKYQKFKSERNESCKTYLTFGELRKIQELDLHNTPSLEKNRDYFVFQCYTGQRYSDIENFKWEDLEETSKGSVWNLWQIKGNKKKKVIVPISTDAQAIISKYRLGSCKSNDKIFPTYHNVTSNKYLKRICKLAGINDLIKVVKYKGIERTEITFKKWQKVTTHCARTTFVTLSLEKGMRPEVVQSVTGHEDYKTMKKYLKLTDKVKIEEFHKFWN